MTRMTTLDLPTLGSLLRHWREEKGMKIERAAVYASDLLGREFGRETLRRLELDKSEQWDPLIVTALLRVYERSADDLPDEFRLMLGQRLAKLADLIRYMPTDSPAEGFSHQPSSRKRCTEPYPGQAHLSASSSSA